MAGCLHCFAEADNLLFSHQTGLLKRKLKLSNALLPRSYLQKGLHPFALYSQSQTLVFISPLEKKIEQLKHDYIWHFKLSVNGSVKEKPILALFVQPRLESKSHTVARGSCHITISWLLSLLQDFKPGANTSNSELYNWLLWFCYLPMLDQ